MKHLIQHTWARRVLVAVAALLALWAIAWLAGPSLIRSQLQKHASLALGRSVTVEQVAFQPWSLTLRLQGLQIGGAAGDAAGSTPPLLAVDEVLVDAELQSLLRLAPVIDAVHVRRPQVNLTHLGEGRYDIDDLLERFQPKPDDTPSNARFAVFNIRLSDGVILLQDSPKALAHEVNGIQLDVPFLSNLPSKREVVTTPRLAFRLHDTSFDTQASTTPFAEDRHTEARLSIQALDFEPYLPYWPATWPVRPTSGNLNADLAVRFEWQTAPKVSLQGDLALNNLAVLQTPARQNTSATPLLAWRGLAVQVKDFRPLEQHLALGPVTLDHPTLHLGRDSTGATNLEQVLQRWRGPNPPSHTDTPPPSQPTAQPWALTLERFALQQGTLHWHDQTTRPAATLAAEALDLTVSNFAWPEGPAATVQGQLQLAGAKLELQGQAGGSTADLRWQLNALALTPLRPYWAHLLRAELNGELNGTGGLTWARPSDGSSQLRAEADEISLQGWSIGQSRRPDAAGKALTVRGLEADLQAQKVTIDDITAQQPQLTLQRAANGPWMFEQWLAPTEAAAAQATPRSNPAANRPWDVTLKKVVLDGGTVRLRDQAVNAAVDATQWRIQLEQLRPLDPVQRAMPLQVSGHAAVPGQEAGRLQYRGTLRLPAANGTGLETRGQLQLDRLPLHAGEPYLARFLNFDLLRADASYRGQLLVGLASTGPQLQLRGDAAIDDLRATTRDPEEALLDWRSLNLRGVDVDLKDGQLQRLKVAETVLSDYFARVIISEQGRINLQGLVRSGDVSATTATAAPSTQATPPSASAAQPDIEFGPIALVNGRVRFSDRFIQPNYTANLSELTGSLAAFSNRRTSDAAPALAALSLRGRVEGSATLDISGQLNPLAQPLALDLRGQVRELELPPLTPYSSKYAGYGIERGKLSVDVTYRIEPDGQLQASNQIVLNQLRFGDRIEGSDAPNLPVKLAVALLADRNGVIDINLPISGSLNDPQFRLGPIIVRLVVNLIGKAITAPFALIASAFAGADDLQHLPFAPGVAGLDAAAREKLNQVARALIDRPALQLTVVGHSDLATEQEAWRREALNQRVMAEKRRQAVREGQAADALIQVSPKEYPALLKEVYRRTDITKPRNLVGLAKDISVPDMEKLLLAAIAVGEPQMRELAVARAVAVKDYLIQQQVPAERLFLGGDSPTGGNRPESDQPTSPSAELRLSAR